MQKPTISVLMPAFNASATIEEAMISVLIQTMADFELIVVDDGSTDDTAAIARELANRDSRIRVIPSEHGGIVSACNQALRLAKGTYFARLDADDAMAPNRLERQLEHLRSCSAPKQTLVGSQVRFFPRENLGEGTLRYEGWLNSLETDSDHARNILIESTLAHPSFFGHRTLFESVGGYRDGPFPEDYDLLLRLRSCGATFYTIQEPLTRWREHGERLTHTDERYSFDAFRRAKVMHIERMRATGSLNADRPLVVWGAGSYGRRFMRAMEEQNLDIACCVDIDPRKIGRMIRDGRVEVIGPEQLKEVSDAYVFLAVATPGARAEIQVFLEQHEYREGVDYLAVQ